jgi:hypothetical protein
MSTYTLKGYKSKLIKYAYLVAMERLGKGSSLVLSLALPLSFIMRFIKYYLLRKGFLDGIEGLYATLAYITYLQIVDLLKAFRPRKWDKIATLANSYGLSSVSLHRAFMNKEVLRRDCNNKAKIAWI